MPCNSYCVELGRFTVKRWGILGFSAPAHKKHFPDVVDLLLDERMQNCIFAATAAAADQELA